MGFFRIAHGWRDQKCPPVRKICNTYPTMMKLDTVITYLKKTQKVYESCDTALSYAGISICSPELRKFCYIKKYRYRLHFDTSFLVLLTFLEHLKIVLINMVTILMMSAKLATPDFLKIKVFWNKSYDVTTSVHKLQIWRLLWARSSLTFRQTIECGFTLKLVRDIIITYW